MDEIRHFVVDEGKEVINRALQEKMSQDGAGTIEDMKQALISLGDIDIDVGGSGITDADATVYLTIRSEVLLTELREPVRKLIQELRSIKRDIEDRLGGQDSIVELLCQGTVPAPTKRARSRKA